MGSTAAGGYDVAWVAADVISDRFPAGLRVLVVDDDPTCLMILERMLRACFYEVTKCNRAEIALSLLRENRTGFDIVISDVHMPDMDGFKLLEYIGLEMDLPVIMMSADDGKSVVMKGVTHGACDYLIKPVRIEAIKNIWQHVIRKRKNEWKEVEQTGRAEDEDQPEKPSEDVDYSSSGNEGGWGNSKRRKDEEDEAEDRDDSSTLKKPRVVWSVELHQQFVAAVNQLGIDKAVPKKILELMNVPGLTRENVASHLQKYRLYLRRLSAVSQHPGGVNPFFLSSPEATFGALTSGNGLDLQAFSVAGQLSAQSLAALQAGFGRPISKSGIPLPLVDQRNVYSFENPNIRFGDGQQQVMGNCSKKMNLLHGIPTNMEPKHLVNLHQSVQCGINMQSTACDGDNRALQIQMAQQQTRGKMVNDTSGGHLSRVPSSVGQPILSNGIAGGLLGRNISGENGRGTGYSTVSQTSAMLNYPSNTSVQLASNSMPLGSSPVINSLTSKGSFQPELNSARKESGEIIQSYDIFNGLYPHKPRNWELQHVGMSYDAAAQSRDSLQDKVDASTSHLVQQKFPSSQTGGLNRNATDVGRAMFLAADGTAHRDAQHTGQHLNTLISDNSMWVKAETLPNSRSQVTGMLFPDQFGQEDLMSALLKQQEGAGPAETPFDFDKYTLDNIPV